MNKIGNVVMEDEKMFRKFYNWVFGKEEGWFMLMVPVLIFLVYINITCFRRVIC